MVIHGLKTRLDQYQLHRDMTDMCRAVAGDQLGDQTGEQADDQAGDPMKAARLEQTAWRWWHAGFRNARQLRRILELEQFYNCGLYDQAERIGLLKNLPATYGDYVRLLEVFDRG